MNVGSPPSPPARRPTAKPTNTSAKAGLCRPEFGPNVHKSLFIKVGRKPIKLMANVFTAFLRHNPIVHWWTRLPLGKEIRSRLGIVHALPPAPTPLIICLSHSLIIARHPDRRQPVACHQSLPARLSLAGEN
ncbi:MAG: hypothetical protein JKX85_15710 [Phycisphaeraceae bacterium]|nr:hypothetical protein [Phycisphaeraceae bacterium]